MGHTVQTAASGVEALEQFRAERYDLVVTDRAMPDMNGDQLAASIKQLAPSTPIIMLTGFGAFMEATHEKPPGVDVVVTKPISFSTFQEAVAKAMGRQA